MTILIIILTVSLLFNLIVIIYDFIPFYSPKIRRKLKPDKSLNRDFTTLEESLVKASVKVMKRKRPMMVWHDPKGIAEQVFELKHHTSRTSFKKFNYPRAFLLYGICEYALATNDKILLNDLKSEFDKFVDLEGNPTFKLDKVDQSNFGVVAIKLYEKFGDQKYYNFAQIIFEELLRNYEENKTYIFYRPDQLMWLNDVLGLTIPFLTEYYNLTGNLASIKIAKEQVKHFINGGIDLKTYIPAHGIDLASGLKIGSINWGRGIGWFYIGLKYLYEFDGSFKEEYLGLTEKLLLTTTTESLWSQFPGSSDFFDASATLMFLYCLPSSRYNLTTEMNKLDKYISKDGFIKQTSGDTYSDNIYSKTFGKSEFSQGMMLLLLSKHKR